MKPIPWPDGYEPAYQSSVTAADGSLPSANVLVVTWTAAEFTALADVLTPNHPKEDWSCHTYNFSDYEPRLTEHSPAKNAKCLGEFAMTEIHGTSVLCFHSELHLCTDGDPPPLVDLWGQIISEVSPDLVISTGTAGGIGADVSLGDVFVVSNAKFNCTQTFAEQAWAQKRFAETPSPVPTGGTHLAEAKQFLLVNSGQLNPVAIHKPEVGLGGDVETADNPAFANTNDSLGVAKNDRLAHTVETDDATLPLALAGPPAVRGQKWLSIRNVSDPQVDSTIGNLEAQKQWAFNTYAKYGYWTTTGSAITCWGVIADLATS